MAAQLTAMKRSSACSDSAMDGAGDHFLAGAALAGKRTVDGVGATLRAMSSTRCIARLLPTSRVVDVAIQLALEPLVIEIELAIFEQPANLGEHLVEQDRLHQNSRPPR